jgi:hypothetical protein
MCHERPNFQGFSAKEAEEELYESGGKGYDVR